MSVSGLCLCPGYVLSGLCLSGLCPVRVVSVRVVSCPGCVCPGCVIAPSNTPCKAGLMAEPWVEGGGQAQGGKDGKDEREADEARDEVEADDVEASHATDMEVKEERRIKEGNCLAGFLEGRGTYVGTPSPPAPKPEVLLEGQGTPLGTLIPQGEGKETREVEKEGSKEGRK